MSIRYGFEDINYLVSYDGDDDDLHCQFDNELLFHIRDVDEEMMSRICERGRYELQKRKEQELKPFTYQPPHQLNGVKDLQDENVLPNTSISDGVDYTSSEHQVGMTSKRNDEDEGKE